MRPPRGVGFPRKNGHRIYVIHYLVCLIFEVKRALIISAIQTVGEENGGWLRLSAGKAGGHRGIPHGKQGSRRNGVEVVPSGIWRERFLWNWGITSHSLYLTFYAASLDEPSIGSLWRVRDEPQSKAALFHFDAMKRSTRLRSWQPGTRIAQLLCGLAQPQNLVKRAFPATSPHNAYVRIRAHSRVLGTRAERRFPTDLTRP